MSRLKLFEDFYSTTGTEWEEVEVIKKWTEGIRSDKIYDVNYSRILVKRKDGSTKEIDPTPDVWNDHNVGDVIKAKI